MSESVYPVPGRSAQINRRINLDNIRGSKVSEGVSSDHLVCAIADINDAILVALDGDMKRIAQGHGVGSGKYLKLGLIKLSCFEPDAAARVQTAMSLIEHEWNAAAGTTGRRIFIEISDRVIRSFR
jgi:predicted nuclease of predicted toxin-antitoxin system